MLTLTTLTPHTVTLDGTLADFQLFARYNHWQNEPLGLPMGATMAWQNNLEYSRGTQFSGIIFQAALVDCPEPADNPNWCGIFCLSMVWVWTLASLVCPDHLL
jgi:hypothetical protein